MLPKGSVKPRKPVKLLDTKVLIVTLSTAITIGMWNVFSHNALEIEKTQANALPPQDPVNSETQDMAPLPTLVPLLDASARNANPGTVVQQDQVAQPTSLRSVNAPSQVVVQKVKPIVESGITNTTGGGGGKDPVARTRSSR
jgi:hypothetical protein